MFPKLQNTLYTLNRCGLCLGTNLVSRYNNGRREGEETTRISLLSLWYDWIIIPSTLLHNYGYCSKLLLLLKATLIDTSLTDSRYIEVGFFSIDSRNLLDQLRYPCMHFIFLCFSHVLHLSIILLSIASYFITFLHLYGFLVPPWSSLCFLGEVL